MRQLGRLVARMHLQGETGRFEHRPAIDIDTYGNASHDYLLEQGFIPDELQKAYESIAEHLFADINACYDRASGTRSIRLHADFHPGNVLVAGEQLHIVDLDDARSGPAIQDLWMFLSGDRNEQTPQLATLLEGYEVQAFRFGDCAYAFQFHLEVDRSLIERWLNRAGYQSLLQEVSGTIDPERIRELSNGSIKPLMELSNRTFSRWIDRFETGSRRRTLPSR